MWENFAQVSVDVSNFGQVRIRLFEFGFFGGWGVLVRVLDPAGFIPQYCCKLTFTIWLLKLEWCLVVVINMCDHSTLMFII
jgi:hypothetical protein